MNDFCFDGAAARPTRSAHIFQKFKEVPWRGIMIYIKADAKYVEDLDAESDVVEWPAPSAVAEPPVHVPSEPPVDACAVAKSAFRKYKYGKDKSRVDCRRHPYLFRNLFHFILGFFLF